MQSIVREPTKAMSWEPTTAGQVVNLFRVAVGTKANLKDQ